MAAIPQKIRIAEQQPAEIIGVRDRSAEEVAKQDRDENVDGDNAYETRRRELDAVDEAVHDIALHSGPTRRSRPHGPASYFAMLASSSASAASGSAPVRFTAAAQSARSGAAASCQACI